VIQVAPCFKLHMYMILLWATFVPWTRTRMCRWWSSPHLTLCFTLSAPFRSRTLSCWHVQPSSQARRVWGALSCSAVPVSVHSSCWDHRPNALAGKPCCDICTPPPPPLPGPPRHHRQVTHSCPVPSDSARATLLQLLHEADIALGSKLPKESKTFCGWCLKESARMRCSRCGASYCKEAHQRLHWSIHKQVCKRAAPLAAPTRITSASGGSSSGSHCGAGASAGGL
jgi:hypothetical protein